MGPLVDLKKIRLLTFQYLMGLDAIRGGLAVHPEGDVTQDFAGQEFVKGFRQFLRIIDPSQSKILPTRHTHF